MSLYTSVTFAIDIRFNNKNGLEDIPKNPAWSISQDSNGLLWFGNNNGLFSYDGYRVKSISETIPAFTIKNIRSVVHDRGDIWIGTKDNGLYKITGGKIQKYYPENNSNNNETDNISSMIKTENGLWFGTLNSLNYLSSLDDYIKLDIPQISNDGVKLKVKSIIEISDKKLFIATQFSAYLFDKSSSSFTQYSINGFDNSYIRSAYKDDKNNIWLATDDGIYLKYSSEDSFKRFLKEQINYSIYSVLAKDNIIWVGTIKHGLLKISETDLSISTFNHESNDNTSIAGNSIVKMFLGKNGVLFLASFNGGISQLNVRSLEFGLLSNTSNSIFCSKSSVIYGIDVDKDDVWLSSDLGLIEYNPIQNKCINHKESAINQEISSSFTPHFTFKDSSNIRWIINLYGLSTINELTGKISKVPFATDNIFINFMIETSQGRFLVGTENGLYRYKDNRFTYISISNLNYKKIIVTSIVNITDQQYYIATNQGLAFLDKNDNFSIIESIQSQLPTKDISSVYVEDNKNFWVGTRGFGMYKFSKTGELLFSSSKTQFAHMSILNFLADGNDLWAASDNGLIKINIHTYQSHIFNKEGCSLHTM